MRSVSDAIKPVVSLSPATRTADANGTGVDCKGFRSAMVLVEAGTIDTTDTDETYTINIEESSDNSTYAAVSGLTTTITASDTQKLIRVEGLDTDRSRYLRAVLDVGGTTPSIAGSVHFLLGNSEIEPVGNTLV